MDSIGVIKWSGGLINREESGGFGTAENMAE